jgi:hypothetical protein
MGFIIGTGRWMAHNDEVKRLAGLPIRKYGADESHAAMVDGRMNGEPVRILVMLLTKQAAKALHPRSSKPRRLHAACPACSRLVCAGHTSQHKC